MSESADPSALKLPPLQQSVLDAPTLAALFSDLAACTEIIAILPKTHATQYIEPTAGLTLTDAHTGLADGSFRAVQIRYRYDSQEWCDTLMKTPGGIRVVRICQDDINATLDAGT